MNYLDKLLRKAEKEHDLLKHPYVGTEHLLLALLSEDNDLTEKLSISNLSYNKFKRKIKEIIGEGSKKSSYVLYTPMLRKVINITEDKKNIDDITNVDIFKAIISTKEGIAIRILETMNIDIESLDIDDNNYLDIDESVIITNRDKEINTIFQILMRKNKCNPLLIGDAGVGKTAIVEEIQRRLVNDNVPRELKGYKIINVDMASMVAGTKYRGDFENKIKELLKSVEGKKKILFIDEIHTLVNAGGAEGAISAGNIIKPYLARGKIKCIGATTINEYHEYFEIDEALSRRFQTINIKEPTIEETINILNKLKNNYELYHNIKINDNLITEIVDFADKYIINKKNPDKSIELLDSCCTNAKFNEQSVCDINNLYNIAKEKYGFDFNGNSMKKILENKSIILAEKKYISELNNIDCNLIYIDGTKYKNYDDLFDLLGNPNHKNRNYILKSVIDNPLGIMVIINYNYNELLNEYIYKILNNRCLIDSFGNDINLNNYIIIMEKVNNNQNIGFTSDNKNIHSNLHFIDYSKNLLLNTN